MDAVWLEYGWTLIVLIGLEGILSADNALVLAVMVKHLPDNQKGKAINYGVIGAFVCRFIVLFAISFLAHVWEVQAIGAAYLIYLGSKHIIQHVNASDNEQGHAVKKPRKEKGFWLTVATLGLADIAFAIDSILAAVALAIVLPETVVPTIGGMDGAQFMIVLLAGIAGLIMIKFASTWFLTLLEKRPGLETTAYAIVAWVGVKLAIITLCHEDVGILSQDFAHGMVWTITFWGILLAILIGGWVLSGQSNKNHQSYKHDRKSV